LTVDVPIGRSKAARQADHANYDQDHWPGAAEIEVPAAYLVKEEQNAERDKDPGTHEASNRTARAMATNAITH
jgi:hypothetical protein